MEEAKQTLLDLLDKVAKEQEYVDHTVDVVEVNSGGANITSALYGATLRTKGKSDLKLFAKVALVSDHGRKMNPMKDPFAIELYFYTKLQKEFERLEEKHGVPEEQKVRMPKLYGSHSAYLSETLVLEDLNAMGFKNFNRSKSADLEYVTTVIDLMAKFHSLSLAYHHDDPEGFQQCSNFLTIDFTKMIAMLPTMQPKMLTNALEAVNEEHRDKLEKYLTQEPSPLLKMTEMYRSKNRNILVHGDFKPTNLMHRRRNGKLEIVPLDFQLVGDGDPTRDLVYFLIAATDEAFCREHYHAMLGLYHDRLRDALSRFQIDVEDVYSEKTYRAQLKEDSMLGLLIAVALLPMILADEEKIPAFDQDFEMTEFFVEGSKLYKERLNGVVNNYVNWGLL